MVSERALKRPFSGIYKDQFNGEKKRAVTPAACFDYQSSSSENSLIWFCACPFPSNQFCLAEADVSPAFPAYDDMVGQADSQKLPGFLHPFRKPDILLARQHAS